MIYYIKALSDKAFSVRPVCNNPRGLEIPAGPRAETGQHDIVEMLNKRRHYARALGCSCQMLMESTFALTCLPAKRTGVRMHCGDKPIHMSQLSRWAQTKTRPQLMGNR